MDEYITKENAQLARPEWRCRNDQYDCGWNDCINEYLDMIDTIPAADVVPVRHGKWEFIESAPWCHKCNQCQCFLKIDDITDGKANYCPNCGAKMDGESNA